jgi:hypothetical protein
LHLVSCPCERVSIAKPAVTFIDVSENSKKIFSVLVVFKDGFLFVPAGSDVIYGAGIFYAEGTGHALRLSEDLLRVK